MTNEPRVSILLDLGDGRPPIACNSREEAEFLADVWLGGRGHAEALARAKLRLLDLIRKRSRGG